MNLKLVIVLAFFSMSCLAKDLSGDITITRMSWDLEKKMYRLELSGHAGVYFAAKKFEKCILYSVRNRKVVKAKYSLKDLTLKSCDK